MDGLTQLQKIFLFTVVGLLGYWVVAFIYEIYLRITVKCVNCIVEDPGRLRFFVRLSLVLTVACLAGTVAALLASSYLVFVLFILSLYFIRVYILARSRYKRLMQEEGNGYDPNITFSEDIRETLKQFKLLITSPVKFFRQNH